MNIRKHWKKLLLTTTALFWASCTSENENTFPTIGQDTPHAVDPSASSDSHIESSSENAVESSSSEAKAPSSSNVDESSSSAGPLGPYKLARDSSVTCKDTIRFDPGCWESWGKENPFKILEELKNNKIYTLETLEKKEEDLIRQFDGIDSPSLYGCNFSYFPTPLYKCSNGSTYSQDTHKIQDSLLYSNDEYYEKYYEKPSPLCQKIDFICSYLSTYCYEINEEQFIEDILANDKNSLVDNAKITAKDSLSKQQETCLDSKIYTFSHINTPVATKQICDGDTIVNPRYQAILDSNKAYVNKQIDNCLKLKEQESDTEN